MTDAVGAWFANLVASNSAALVPALLLMVCAAVAGTGWVLRERLTRWWAATIQTVGLLMGLGVLALQTTRDGWLVELDHTLTAWFVAHRNPLVDVVALTITTVFGPIEAAVAALFVVAATVLRFRSLAAGLTVLVTVGAADVCCTVLKLLMARSRPPLGMQVTLETDYSFPSGHVTGTVAVFGMVAVVGGMGHAASVRRSLAGVAVFVTGAVAWSRLYLGVHWFTDVLAAVLLGSAAVIVGATLLGSVASSRVMTSSGLLDRTAMTTMPDTRTVR